MDIRDLRDTGEENETRSRLQAIAKKSQKIPVLMRNAYHYTRKMTDLDHVSQKQYLWFYLLCEGIGWRCDFAIKAIVSFRPFSLFSVGLMPR